MFLSSSATDAPVTWVVSGPRVLEAPGPTLPVEFEPMACALGGSVAQEPSPGKRPSLGVTCVQPQGGARRWRWASRRCRLWAGGFTFPLRGTS